jgi:hypothetical protein
VYLGIHDAGLDSVVTSPILCASFYVCQRTKATPCELCLRGNFDYQEEWMEEAQMIVMKIYSQDLSIREADSRGLAASTLCKFDGRHHDIFNCIPG